MNGTKSSAAKRLLCLFFTFVMIIGMIPIAASADQAAPIDTITVTDVVEPVEGEHPVFSCKLVNGDGYYLDAIRWWDIEANQFMDEDDVFVAGRSYEINIYLFPEDGCVFAERDSINATVNGKKAKRVGTFQNRPESRIVEMSYNVNRKDVPVYDVYSWEDLQSAFTAANANAETLFASENAIVRLQADLYLDIDSLPRDTRHMVKLSVRKNMTLDFNGHTLTGYSDLSQDEDSEVESFIEIDVHPNYYIEDMETVFTITDSVGGGGINFTANQWRDSQLAALHVNHNNTYYVRVYNSEGPYLYPQSTGNFTAKLVIDGGNFKMNCSTVKFGNGTHAVGLVNRYRGTVVASHMKTVINGGRFEAYCDGVVVTGDNMGARDLTAFGLETCYVGNSLFADPESEWYNKFEYGEYLTINDGIFISDNGYSVRHFDKYWIGVAEEDAGFSFFAAPRLNGGIYVGPVNFTSKSFMYLNNGSDFLNRMDLTKITDMSNTLVLDGEPKAASQITLEDLADEDTELFAILAPSGGFLKEVFLNGVSLGTNLKGTCITGATNTLKWTFDDLDPELKELGFYYNCKVKDRKDGSWRTVPASYSDGTGAVEYNFSSSIEETVTPYFMIELCINKNVVQYSGYRFNAKFQKQKTIYSVSAIWVNQPLDGERPDFNFSASLASSPYCDADSILWYNVTDKKYLSSTNSSDVFVAGKTYDFTVTFKAKEGYTFADASSLNVTFNKDLKPTFVSLSGDKKIVTYKYTFKAAELLTTASATIDGIVALASYGKRSGISGDADKYAVSADVFGLYEAASANTVMPGDSCRIVVEFTPKDGYGFADPEKTTVKAKINGKNAVLYDYFDGSILFYIDYYISYCNIAKVDFDYDEPFVGDTPADLTFAINNLFEMPNDKILITDIYWADNGTDENRTWVDMKDSDTFLEGHNYYCMITFGLDDPDDLYIYALDNEIGFEVIANGVNIPDVYDDNSGNNYNPPSGTHKEFTVSLYFKPSSDSAIRNIEATVTEPAAGSTAKAISIDKAANHISSASTVWSELRYAENGSPMLRKMSASDTFEQGRSYRMQITLAPQSGYVFSSNVDVTVNGRTATGYDISSDGQLVAYMDYDCGTGVSVTGTVTSYGNSTDEVNISLIRAGETYPAYGATVRGNSANYTLSGVASGTYTLQVSKKDHVTKSYTVVVGSSAVTQNAKIYLLGDVNFDGAIDIADAMTVFYHVAKKFYIDISAHEYADINADGAIDIEDAMKVFYFVAKKTTSING